MLILMCVHLGELRSPMPGAKVNGSCLCCEATAQSQVQDDTRRNNHSGGVQVSSSGVSSYSIYHSSQSTGAWMLWGQEMPICAAQGIPAAGVSLLSLFFLASTCPGAGGGNNWILGCIHRCPWLEGLCHWNRAPGVVQPPPCGATT